MPASCVGQTSGKRLTPLWNAAQAGIALPKEFPFTNPRLPREKQQEQQTRDNEIDPKKHYPSDVERKLLTQWPKDFKIDIEKALGSRPKPEG